MLFLFPKTFRETHESDIHLQCPKKGGLISRNLSLSFITDGYGVQGLASSSAQQQPHLEGSLLALRPSQTHLLIAQSLVFKPQGATRERTNSKHSSLSLSLSLSLSRLFLDCYLRKPSEPRGHLPEQWPDILAQAPFKD